MWSEDSTQYDNSVLPEYPKGYRCNLQPVHVGEIQRMEEPNSVAFMLGYAIGTGMAVLVLVGIIVAIVGIIGLVL